MGHISTIQMPKFITKMPEGYSYGIAIYISYMECGPIFTELL